jgi:RNA polymerase sigma-70 factor (ECF subfamily)
MMQVPAGSTEDKELTLAFKRGEDGSYQAIYDRYHARVKSVCRRMLANPDDAAEAAQETFLRVYQALGRFNGRYQLGPWVTRIATNVCLDHLRARTRRPSDPVPSDLFELEFDQEAEQHGPEAIVIRDSESRHVRRVLSNLPAMHRAAIVLRDFEGLSYEEISIALGVTESQVKSLIHRARQNFRRSWRSSVVAAFFPIRNLFQRIKDFGPTATDQVTSAATASSCVSASAAERICAAAAAVIFTGGIASGVVGHGQPALSSEKSSVQAPAAASPLLAALKGDQGNLVQARHIHRAGPKRARKDRTSATTPADPTTEPAPDPVPTAAPSPSPTTEPEPSTDPSGGEPSEGPAPAPDPTPSLAPGDPEGFVLAFDSTFTAEQTCSCLGPTTVESETVAVGDAGLSSFSQRTSGTAKAAGSPAYGLTIAQSGDATSHRMDFGLRTNEGLYMYRGTGSLVERGETEWGGLSYRYSGTYELASRPTSTERMPSSGTYTVEIFISWRETRITYANFALN